MYYFQKSQKRESYFCLLFSEKKKFLCHEYFKFVCPTNYIQRAERKVSTERYLSLWIMSARQTEIATPWAPEGNKKLKNCLDDRLPHKVSLGLSNSNILLHSIGHPLHIPRFQCSVEQNTRNEETVLTHNSQHLQTYVTVSIEDKQFTRRARPPLANFKTSEWDEVHNLIPMCTLNHAFYLRFSALFGYHTEHGTSFSLTGSWN